MKFKISKNYYKEDFAVDSVEGSVSNPLKPKNIRALRRLYFSGQPRIKEGSVFYALQLFLFSLKD